MKIKKLKITATLFQAIFVVLMSFGVFSAAQAADPVKDSNCSSFMANFNFTGPGGGQQNLIDGIPQYCNAQDLILMVINYGLGMAGVVTVVFLIIGGFWFITSAGNEEQAEKGKKVITNAAIGLAVILMSYAIVRVVSSTLSLGK